MVTALGGLSVEWRSKTAGREKAVAEGGCGTGRRRVPRMFFSPRMNTDFHGQTRTVEGRGGCFKTIMIADGGAFCSANERRSCRLGFPDRDLSELFFEPLMNAVERHGRGPAACRGRQSAGSRFGWRRGVFEQEYADGGEYQESMNRWGVYSVFLFGLVPLSETHSVLSQTGGFSYGEEEAQESRREGMFGGGWSRHPR